MANGISVHGDRLAACQIENDLHIKPVFALQ